MRLTEQLKTKALAVGWTATRLKKLKPKFAKHGIKIVTHWPEPKPNRKLPPVDAVIVSNDNNSHANWSNVRKLISASSYDPKLIFLSSRWTEAELALNSKGFPPLDPQDLIRVATVPNLTSAISIMCKTPISVENAQELQLCDKLFRLTMIELLIKEPWLSNDELFVSAKLRLHKAVYPSSPLFNLIVEFLQQWRVKPVGAQARKWLGIKRHQRAGHNRNLFICENIWKEKINLLKMKAVAYPGHDIQFLSIQECISENIKIKPLSKNESNFVNESICNLIKCVGMCIDASKFASIDKRFYASIDLMRAESVCPVAFSIAQEEVKNETTSISEVVETEEIEETPQLFPTPPVEDAPPSEMALFKVAIENLFVAMPAEVQSITISKNGSVSIQKEIIVVTKEEENYNL